MKRCIGFLAFTVILSLMLSACSTGVEGPSSVPPTVISTTEPTSSTTITGNSSDDAAVVAKLGVDYREHWTPYLIEPPVNSCDYWFIKEGDTYHAYFLIFPKENGQEKQHIAHATSTDFLNWKYEGIILYGHDRQNWDDRAMATGSVVKCGDIYYMMYTGHSSRQSGMGMAISQDLYHWERMGGKAIIPSNIVYKAPYEGVEHTCQVLADPYIYPEPIDGYYYAYINSWASDMPKNSRGCQLMFRSADLKKWEPYKIATLTDDLDRLETCQVWEHGGKWYMSFGGRRVDPNGGDFSDVESANYIYMADSFDGPYLKQEWSAISYISAVNPYIQKQIIDPFGDEVMLVMSPYKGVLWPYRIVYGDNGQLSFDVIYQ